MSVLCVCAQYLQLILFPIFSRLNSRTHSLHTCLCGTTGQTHYGNGNNSTPYTNSSPLSGPVAARSCALFSLQCAVPAQLVTVLYYHSTVSVLTNLLHSVSSQIHEYCREREREILHQFISIVAVICCCYCCCCAALLQAIASHVMVQVCSYKTCIIQVVFCSLALLC